MIESIVLAVIVAIVVGLLLILLGKVLSTINVPIATTIGAFLVQYGWAIGVLAGIWYFITGSPDFIGIRHK